MATTSLRHATAAGYPVSLALARCVGDGPDGSGPWPTSLKAVPIGVSSQSRWAQSRRARITAQRTPALPAERLYVQSVERSQAPPPLAPLAPLATTPGLPPRTQSLNPAVMSTGGQTGQANQRKKVPPKSERRRRRYGVCVCVFVCVLRETFFFFFFGCQ
jgi:hypothetical protein